MFINRLFPGIMVMSLLVAGCASGVARPTASSQAGFACSAENPVGGVAVKLTEEGKADLAENLKFDPEALQSHIERALKGNALINTDRKDSLPLLLVEVKDIRVRSNFSAVMWGFMAGNDHIVGDIVVKTPAGAEIDRFEVSVSYALGGLAGGMDSARMDWLYETFAKETIKELTQAAGSKSASSVAFADLKLGDFVRLELNSGSTVEMTVTNIAKDSINGQVSDGSSRPGPRMFERSEIKQLILLKRPNG